MKRTLSVLFIFIGVALMLYPKGTQLYSTYMQKKLMNEWEEQTRVESYKSLDQVFVDSANHEETEPDSIAINDHQQPAGKNEKFQKGVLGIIEINKIKVKLPILEGASLQNLKIAAGHLEGTAPLGKKGNTAIAAHRSRTYGNMFNRLNELKPGDEITVIDRNHDEYIYQVYSTFIVKPDDLSVLEGEGNDQILTLITCDPIDTGTHRLIVHAKVKQFKSGHS